MIIFGIEICPAVIKAILAVIVIGCVTVVFLIKLYAYITCGFCNSRKKMDGKTVIITGATSGIGKETARELAKRGARVILACRNLETAKQTRDEIAKSTGNENVLVKRLDLASQKSIRQFAEDINRTEERLNVLIHNAGTAETKSKVSEDGLELTMATNHFGPFLLTHLLIDLLKRSAPSRIVVVASELYRFASLNLNKINPTNAFFPGYIYYVSKYANICFTRELAHRLKGTEVTANCLHPGMIDSGIWRNIPVPLNWPLKLVVKFFFKSPAQGCQTTVHLTVSDELESVSGKYFMDCRERELSRGAQDNAKAKKLWELSEKFANIKDTDPRL